jgi:hypothetical protein
MMAGGNPLKDRTVRSIFRLLLGGLCVMAWLIQPEPSDTPFAISMLMFLRFVPLFVAAGSIWGRAGRGAMIGIGLFFFVMGTEALSILMWDV